MGRPDLPEDLALPRNHRVETGGDPEQVKRCALVAEAVEDLGELAVRAKGGERGGRFDALMAVTLLTWVVYGVYLLARYELGWRGRRAAYIALLGFLLVITVRLALPATHFA